MSNASTPAPRATEPTRWVNRHPLPVRVTHWINVVALTVMLSSGLGIFNAHPALYWGQASFGKNPAWLEISARQAPDGTWIGITRVFGREFDTTGVLGLSKDTRGELDARGFPWWVTTPHGLWLAMSRSWHFFFAWILIGNGLVYLAWSFKSGHFRRALLGSKGDGHGAGERPDYNRVQRLAYLILIFVVMPLCITTGHAMSPWLDAVVPGWIEVYGGRQSARSLHFIGAGVLVAFVVIHVGALVADRPWNRLRAMITGRHHAPPRSEHD